MESVQSNSEHQWCYDDWQNRPLASSYPIIYLDGIHLKVRRDGKVENIAVYVVLGPDLNGHRDVLEHWVGYEGKVRISG